MDDFPASDSQPIHIDRITLDSVPYEIAYWNDGEFDYTRFAIRKEGREVFNSLQHGIAFEGGLAKTEAVWITGLEQNGRPTFVFDLADGRPDPASIVVEELAGELVVTVQDEKAVSFQRMDGQQGEVLVGFSSYGEYPLAPALQGVYVWVKDHYEPSSELTQKYWEDQLSNRIKAFEQESNEETLNDVMSAYLLLNRLQDGKDWMLKYAQSTESGEVRATIAAFQKDFIDGITPESYYDNWMKNLDKLSRPT
ncbi:hypothetical protein SAMN05216312_113215 [Cohnella sp. OV330]|nr:hypothetical protein SAMN05216312_113215 [Cohnella sp. OV330]